nr:JAB domain-containing protein [Alteromonas macleodii]
MAKRYCQAKIAHKEHEVFALLLVDSQHQVIEFKEVSIGTIDAAAVYPREVVKAVLLTNSTACILCHNHPSAVNVPSEADKRITRQLSEALALIDVKILDHFIVSPSGIYSFAEHGLL